MMKPILFWNLRGVGTSQKRLSSLVRKFLPGIVAVAEPFLPSSRMDVLQSRLNMIGSVSNDEASGKIWVMWAIGVEVSVVAVTNQSIAILMLVGITALVSRWIMLSVCK